MKPSPAIVWFRRDLRLADNPAISHAMREHGTIIPVYVHSPEEEGRWRPGAASNWWLHESLSNLASDLTRRGSRLTIRKGQTGAALFELARETGASAVYWNRRYEPAVIGRDTRLKQELRENGLHAESFAGNLLFEPWTIQTQTGKPYQVFTPFWNTCKEKAMTALTEAPTSLAAPASWPVSAELNELRLMPMIDWAGGFRETWSPGEAGAQRLVSEFADGGQNQYSGRRDRPDTIGTSRLSPHLAFGEIAPQRIREAIAAEPYRRQLVWREFAHHLLYHFPETAQQPLRPEFARFPWRMNADAFSAWTRGKTGYPIVDAGMRELWHTGWMHNRVRMVAASFLVKHLLIPWQEGAAWFWDTLVDADLANNTLGWQWTAGCGADAAPFFRIFNPVLQGEKFDPEGNYVRRWVPELREVPTQWIHKPWLAPTSDRPDYPGPIVDHNEARLRALAALAETRSQPARD